jgi:hypothetical protein
MEEVLALRLDADWVVLSACNTASADGKGGEAVSGLGRAFFYARARSLLVSNWAVETTSARLLTTELFRRQSQTPALTRGRGAAPVDARLDGQKNRWRQVSRCQGEANPRDRPRVDVAAYIRLFIC